MIVLHTTKSNYEPSAQVKVLGRVVNTTYLGTEDHRTAFALVLSGHAELTARDTYWAYLYARYVIEGRWPPGEAVIAADPRWVYYYARAVIKDRWPPGEAVIATDPEFAYRYARDVIEERWPEAEAVIATDPYYKDHYEQRFRVEL